ncbi:MAG: magnesium transporter CorA family protein [Candidatus Levybacteria bacterium]|nr:magnesium transporter CorA family protein [Candidatus Levybacteria bacterium]
MNVQTVNFERLSFVNVEKPTDFEMKYLKNNYYFNSLNLEDYVHKTQIPKIENHKKYDLIVLRFPLFTENVPQNSHQYGVVHLPAFHMYFKKRRLLSSYVNFFIAQEYIVVVHDGTLPQIEHIFSLCQKTLHNRTEYMSQGSVFLAYKIIDALVDTCFPVINELTATIDKIDKDLEYKQSQRILEDISTTRRNLVVFHTMIKPILPLFSSLEEGKYENLNGTMQPFWGNVLDHLQKILDRVEDNQELIGGISESSEFLLRSKTNQIMATLTIMFTLTIPATVIGTFYGMNILLPGGIEEGPWNFWGHYTTLIFVVILSVIPLILMLLYFKHKKWY